MMWIIIVAVVLVVILALMYNSLIKKKNQVDNAWSQINTQLQRRFDLIPNLVETVKGYAAHEKQIFEEVANARAKMMGSNSVADSSEANNMLTGTLKSLFAVAENYPQLKANENFLQLQGELSATENKIAFARQYYNDSVVNFNNAIQIFPLNIFASMMSLKAKDYFNVDEEAAKKPVQVKF